MDFKVVAISVNANSFGLNAYILIAKNGEVYRVLAYKPRCRFKEDSVLYVSEAGQGSYNFAEHSFECPERLGDAMPNVVEAVWGETCGRIS